MLSGCYAPYILGCPSGSYHDNLHVHNDYHYDAPVNIALLAGFSYCKIPSALPCLPDMDSDTNFTHQSQSIISKLIPEYNSTPLVLSVIFKIYSLLKEQRR